MAVSENTTPLPEYRALEIFSTVPADCRLYLMPDDRHAPHVRAGEFVVVDLTDTAFESGELYLIDWQTGRERFGVMQARSHVIPGMGGVPRTGVWFLPLDNPRSEDEIKERCRAGRRIWLADGPLNPAYLADYLKGRVIGLFQGAEPDLSGLALPSGAGNAP